MRVIKNRCQLSYLNTQEEEKDSNYEAQIPIWCSMHVHCTAWCGITSQTKRLSSRWVTAPWLVITPCQNEASLCSAILSIFTSLAQLV